MQNSQVSWQVETQGQIYEADFEELKQWIVEGAVLSSDKVRRGDLRWLPIEKVPELYIFIKSNDFNYTPPDTFAADSFAADIFAETGEAIEIDPASENSTEEAVWEIGGEKVCYLHKDLEAVYGCAICKKLFCKICPESYGGSVKLCPICGSLCRPADEPFDIHKAIGAVSKPYFKVEESSNHSERENRIGLRISDFHKAFSYSLQYTKDLILKVTSSIFPRSFKRRR